MNAGTSANYTKVKAQQLQRTLYLAAKENPKAQISCAVRQSVPKRHHAGSMETSQSERGSAGIDGETIEYIVKEYGEERFIEEYQAAAQWMEHTVHHPVTRKEIPKGDGKTRPSGYSRCP